MDIRQKLYDEGVALCTEFLRLNNIALPKFSVRNLSSTGLYSNRTVYVNLPRTALPVIKPYHMRWSWPGWKTDRTAIGVVGHEVGHHVDRGFSSTAEWRRCCGRGAKRVSSYEPCPSEAFAETMRMFIQNPELVRYALPTRWEAIQQSGLKPLRRMVRKGVDGCLADNDWYIEAATKWAAK